MFEPKEIVTDRDRYYRLLRMCEAQTDGEKLEGGSVVVYVLDGTGHVFRAGRCELWSWADWCERQHQREAEVASEAAYLATQTTQSDGESF